MAHREVLSAALADVVDRASALAEPSERELVSGFVPLFLAEIHDDDLVEHAQQIAERSLSQLRFGRRRNPGEILVEIDSPTDALDSTLFVLTEDAPFLVDTIRLVLERHDAPVAFMVHPMIDVANPRSTPPKPSRMGLLHSQLRANHHLLGDC